VLVGIDKYSRPLGTQIISKFFLHQLRCTISYRKIFLVPGGGVRNPAAPDGGGQGRRSAEGEAVSDRGGRDATGRFAEGSGEAPASGGVL
jgi:hypothetical protein